ncbi:MAG: alpha-amylase family glycosyl hydrolase [Maricaulaceae bacterium]
MARFYRAALSLIVVVVLSTLSAWAQDLPLVRAELAGPRAVWVRTSGDARPPLTPDAYRLARWDGAEIAVSAVTPRTARQALLVPAEPLDLSTVYFLELPGQDARARLRFDGWFRTLYSAKPLGAVPDAAADRTTLALFAPRADAVSVHLFRERSAARADEIIVLARDGDGVWSADIPGDRHGWYYAYQVDGPEGPGNTFYGATETLVSDPYAKVYDETTGRARIWRDAFSPPQPVQGGRPPMQDVIAYEVHVQDFTDLLPVDPTQIGPLEAMATGGLTNARGARIGFDHVVDLGVNVLHLMPVQEYLHYPDTDWTAWFGADPRAQAMGVAEENYQWGYRTTHAFAIEGRFRPPGAEPGAEPRAFRDLVDAYHAQGLAVIVDIVPNHTGENMDGRNFVMNFNGIDRYYYYRLNEAGAHAGAFGNEVKTEDRPMVQRWLIDQCRDLMTVFGVDGFRIDLAGQIDEQTLIALRQALPEDAIIYGEPWIDIGDPYVRAHPDWAWYKADSPITFFQDEARNAFKGSPFEIGDKARDRGFAGGNAQLREAAKAALLNAYPEEAASPTRGINYLDIHDNWALADRFATQDLDGRHGVDEDAYKIAATLLLTSLGPVVLHGGVEMLRSKGLAPIEEWVGETPQGPIYFKGQGDTYNLRAPNRFNWSRVGETAEAGPDDVAKMTTFWRDLIALRNSELGAVFRRAEPAPEGYYRWIASDNSAALGYDIGEALKVLLNPSAEPARFDVSPGRWRRIVGDAAADVIDINPEPAAPTPAPREERPQALELPPGGLAVFLRDPEPASERPEEP